MVYTVTVKPSNKVFEVELGETILEAALRLKLPFPYGCRSGVCGSCKGRVLSGNYHYDKTHAILTEDDSTQGFALFCQARPTSDLKIEMQLIHSSKDIRVRTFPSKLLKMNKLASDVMQLRLRLPEGQRLQFLPGQYIEIILPDGQRRSFSLARAPHDNGLLELHIRRVAGGFFTNHVFEEMEEKALIRFEGPFGSFTIDKTSNKPLIMIAGGTGFAPIKSILEHLFAENDLREISFYWGARHKESLYMDDLVKKWEKKYLNFSYVPVLSDALENDNWKGRAGFVHKSVSLDIEDFSKYAVYACGPPVMIDSIKAEFSRKGLKLDQFFTDAFTFSRRV